MDGCRAMRSNLMLYVDHELDADRSIEFERHLEECKECARFVERSMSMEELLESTLAPAVDARKSDDFLKTVRKRLGRGETEGRGSIPPGQESVRDPADAVPLPRAEKPRRMHAIPALTAAAAVVLLLWAYTLLNDKTRETGVPADASPLAADLQPSDTPASPAGFASETRNTALEAERRRVHAGFSALLAGLAVSPEDDLYARYREAVAPLEQEGWRTDVLLSGALKRETGEALRTAVRLSRRLPAPETLPDLVPSLARLLADDECTIDVMESLAVLGGPRAAAALGKTLARPELRDRGLELLEGMEGPGSAREIAEAAIAEMKEAHPQPAAFAAAAILALGRMGSAGLDGILAIYEQSGFSPSVVRSLASARDPARRLADRLAGARSIPRGPELRLAAALRLEEALPALLAAADDPAFRKDYTALIAMVGGPEAVRALFDLYTGPASLRERRIFAASLAEVFDLHPGETGHTLDDALVSIDEEDRDVLVAMLGESCTAGACRALGWIVENSPKLAAEAALNLARAGSEDALAVLLELLDGARLSGEARLAAAAAAFHLGGDAVLERLAAGSGREPGRTPASLRSAPDLRRILRRGVLTDTRFEKIQSIIAQYTKS